MKMWRCITRERIENDRLSSLVLQILDDMNSGKNSWRIGKDLLLPFHVSLLSHSLIFIFFKFPLYKLVRNIFLIRFLTIQIIKDTVKLQVFVKPSLDEYFSLPQDIGHPWLLLASWPQLCKIKSHKRWMSVCT